MQSGSHLLTIYAQITYINRAEQSCLEPQLHANRVQNAFAANLYVGTLFARTFHLRPPTANWVLRDAHRVSLQFVLTWLLPKGL